MLLVLFSSVSSGLNRGSRAKRAIKVHRATLAIQRSSLASLFAFKARLICRRLLASLSSSVRAIKSCAGADDPSIQQRPHIFRLQPLVAANLLAALMAPADGELELPRHTRLIIRTSKNEQFVFFAIRQIAGVGVKGGGGHLCAEVTLGFFSVFGCVLMI